MATTSPTKNLMKTPTKKAAEPATKTATKPAAKTAPVEKVEPETAAPVDVIAQTAKQIENLKSGEKAFDMVRDLSDDIDRNYFRLGGVLAKVQAEGWHQDKGFDNFKGWVESEGGMAYRKAMYLITIYNSLVTSNVPWEKVGHLGWTKLKELAPILSPENVDEWVALAESSTVLQLQEAIKAATKGTTEDTTPSPTEEAPKTVTTKTFKLHADQRATVEEALEKAKHQGSTEAEAVALEYVCMEFLSGGKGGTKKPLSLQQVLKGKSIEEVLEAIDTAFPLVVVQASLCNTPEEAAEYKAQLAQQAEAEEAEGDEAAQAEADVAGEEEAAEGETESEEEGEEAEA